MSDDTIEFEKNYPLEICAKARIELEIAYPMLHDWNVKIYKTILANMDRFANNAFHWAKFSSEEYELGEQDWIIFIDTGYSSDIRYGIVLDVFTTFVVIQDLDNYNNGVWVNVDINSLYIYAYAKNSKINRMLHLQYYLHEHLDLEKNMYNLKNHFKKMLLNE